MTSCNSNATPITQLTYQHPWYLAVSQLESITKQGSRLKQNPKQAGPGKTPTNETTN